MIYNDTLYRINVSTTKISLQLIITKSQSQPHLKRMNTRNIYNMSISFTEKVSHYTTGYTNIKIRISHAPVTQM